MSSGRRLEDFELHGQASPDVSVHKAQPATAFVCDTKSSPSFFLVALSRIEESPASYEGIETIFSLWHIFCLRFSYRAGSIFFTIYHQRRTFSPSSSSLSTSALALLNPTTTVGKPANIQGVCED
jgi:hypothetical protein